MAATRDKAAADEGDIGNAVHSGEIAKSVEQDDVRSAESIPFQIIVMRDVLRFCSINYVGGSQTGEVPCHLPNCIKTLRVAWRDNK